MPPALVFAVAYGPDIANWLLGHRAELGDAFERISGPVFDALGDRSASIDRIGGTLASLQQGQTEVIGLLHRHTTKLDDLAATGDAVQSGLGLLTTLSMVGLGVSFLSQAHIALQFARLNQRLKRLEADVHEIKEMTHAEFHAPLNAGLIQLKMAGDSGEDSPDRARELYGCAGKDLVNSTARYVKLMGGGPRAPHAANVLRQHLILSALGEVAVHVQLNEPTFAVEALERALDPLRSHARAVFARTIGAKPTRFLIPALATHGVTLDALAELYRQAGHAGIGTDPHPRTSADLFESFRGHLGDAKNPKFRVSRAVRELRAEFQEAPVVIEDVNRLRGLALAIAAYDRKDRHFRDLATQIHQRIDAMKPDRDGCYAVFPVA